MDKVLITAVSFGQADPDPIRLLEQEHLSYVINPYGRRLRAEELAGIIGPYEVVIAATDPITEAVLDAAPNLRLIARIGIGLDNVPLAATRERGIAVTYTPDAPAAAVAEFTIGQMLAVLLELVEFRIARGMRRGEWHRWAGRRLGLLTAGVIGVGRVGRRGVGHLQSFHPMRILLNDVSIDEDFARSNRCIWTDRETIFREADIITLHVPLTPQTRNMVGEQQLAMMKPDAILINTARGGIVNEAALVAALRARTNFSAAVDVFVEEPYEGELSRLENCLLSCHMGSGTRDCRLRMEMEAAQEVVRYFRGDPFASPVPDAEYLMQVEG